MKSRHPESLVNTIPDKEYEIKRDLSGQDFIEAVKTARQERWDYFIYQDKRVPVTHSPTYGTLVDLSGFDLSLAKTRAASAGLSTFIHNNKVYKT